MPAIQLSGAQVDQALAAWGLSAVRRLDNKYWAVSQEYWDLVLENTPPAPPWVEDFEDCDDVAEGFKVDVKRGWRITAGLIVNRPHMWNIVILDDLSLRLIDAGWSSGPVYVEPGAPGSFYDIVGARVWI